MNFNISKQESITTTLLLNNLPKEAKPSPVSRLFTQLIYKSLVSLYSKLFKRTQNTPSTRLFYVGRLTTIFTFVIFITTVFLAVLQTPQLLEYLVKNYAHLTNLWSLGFSLNILWIGVLLSGINNSHYGLSYYGTTILSWILLLFFAIITWSVLYSHFLFNTSAWLYIPVFSTNVLSPSTTLSFSIGADNTTLIYASLTLSIGVFALLYATWYMRNEENPQWFIIFLYAFTISMVILLSSANIITFLFGWECIGIFSYLLINFWNTKIITFKSAFKAFTFNKISDAGLMLVIILMLLVPATGTSSLHTQFYTPTSFLFNASQTYLFVSGVYLSTIHILFSGILVCAFCKSAQLGFHAWLPDSMEAPVPASALIHSATLVSAGIYLFQRTIPLFMYENNLIMVLKYWAAITACYGGVIAAYQTDLKKILAYSTISHCGFLFYLISLNNNLLVGLYLHFHGWFKSLSFMCAGALIGNLGLYQDTRRMSNVINQDIIFLVLCLAILALASAPFTIGFFNKHYLLVQHHSMWSLTIISTIFIYIAAFTGLFYATNILLNVYSGCSKNHQKVYKLNGLYKSNKGNANQIEWAGPESLLVVFFGMVMFISLNSVLFLDMLVATPTNSHLNGHGVTTLLVNQEINNLGILNLGSLDVHHDNFGTVFMYIYAILLIGSLYNNLNYLKLCPKHYPLATVKFVSITVFIFSLFI